MEETDKLYNIDYTALFRCNVLVRAESEEEAKKKFHENPLEYLDMYDIDDTNQPEFDDEREIYSIYEI